MKPYLRILKFVGLAAAALVAVALVVNVVINARANRQLEERINALRDSGRPASLADFDAPAVAPQENAATYLRRAKLDLDAIDKEVSAAYDAAPQNERDLFDKGQLGPTIQAATDSALAAYPDVIGLIQQAAQCPRYDAQLALKDGQETVVQSLIREFGMIRPAIRVLSYRARLQIAAGQTEDALQTCLLMWQICRQVDELPTLLAHLVALACRGVTVDTSLAVLQSGQLSDASYDALEAELARQDSDVPFRHAMQSEVPFALDNFYEMWYGTGLGALAAPWIKYDAVGYVDLLDEMAARADQTYVEAAEVFDGDADQAGPFTRGLVPTLEATMGASWRMRSLLRALRVQNALARRPQMAEADEIQLDQLGLPPQATLDPFDGKPLRTKKLPDGWVVYSIGVNGKDDGGQIAQLDDVGLGPPPDKQDQATDAD